MTKSEIKIIHKFLSHIHMKDMYNNKFHTIKNYTTIVDHIEGLLGICEKSDHKFIMDILGYNSCVYCGYVK